MLKNYIKIAVRNLWKHKGYSLINILGLSIGIGAYLLIILFTEYELGYDEFHENSDQLYQVYKQRITPNGVQDALDLWVPMKNELVNTYPAVEKATRFYDASLWVESESKTFEETVTYVDPEFFEMFTLPLSSGNNTRPFSQTFSAVVSKEIAQKYFANQNPVGQTLTLGYQTDYVISGVLESVPFNSTLQPEILVQVISDPDYEENETNWGGSFLSIFIQMRHGTSSVELEKQFPDMIQRIWGEETTARTNFKLIHLPELHNYLTGSNQTVYILLGIAFAILLIAIINFVNLSTARSLERAKEVGMRKALGAHRQQLVYQFLGEAIFLSLVSLVIGVLLVEGTLPIFNSALNLELSSFWLVQSKTLYLLLPAAVAIGVLSGLFPSFFLSKFNPSESLKGKLSSKPSGLFFRKVLVTTQFAITTFVLLGTFTVWNQLRFMKTTDLGFNKNGLVIIEASLQDFEDEEASAIRLQTFKNDLENLPTVTSISASRNIPGQWANSFTFAEPQGWTSEQPARVRYSFVDQNYFDTYNIRFLEGENFSSSEQEAQRTKVIVNQVTLTNFGWNSGLDKTIQIGGTSFDVVGVVEDYNFESLENQVEPVLHIFRSPNNATHRYLSARIIGKDIPGTLGLVEKSWNTYFGGREFTYFFADDNFARLYQNQDRLALVTGIFAIVIILIASMGLLGLISLVVIQRTKEIGIRKTLGASFGSLMRLLSADFLKLVTIGFLIASPIAWFLLRYWLNGFAYHIEVKPQIFILSGGVLLLLALLTMGFHITKTVVMNPVESLKNE